MKDVKYLCEDVHKPATVLLVNFHSQQCKQYSCCSLTPTSTGLVMPVGLRQFIHCRWSWLQTWQTWLFLHWFWRGFLPGDFNYINSCISESKLGSRQILSKTSSVPLPKRRGIEHRCLLHSDLSWRISSCLYVGNEHKMANIHLLLKYSLSLSSEFHFIMIICFSLFKRGKKEITLTQNCISRMTTQDDARGHTPSP